METFMYFTGFYDMWVLSGGSFCYRLPTFCHVPALSQGLLTQLVAVLANASPATCSVTKKEAERYVEGIDRRKELLQQLKEAGVLAQLDQGGSSGSSSSSATPQGGQQPSR